MLYPRMSSSLGKAQGCGYHLELWSDVSSLGLRTPTGAQEEEGSSIY